MWRAASVMIRSPRMLQGKSAPPISVLRFSLLIGEYVLLNKGVAGAVFGSRLILFTATQPAD
jgi:hypothetical protein